MKTCIKCKRSDVKFNKDKSRKDGLQNRCQRCKTKEANLDYKNNPKKYSQKHRKKTYGLSKEQYEAMVLAQRSLCKICNLPKPLVVDHCHKTNVVRGLLCNACNTGIGFFKDSAATCLSAANYLDPNVIKN